MTTATLAAFLLLCVLARVAYSLDTVLTGQLARRVPATEVAMWRGLSLAITMAPLLLFVPAQAWGRVPAHWRELAAAAVLASLCNISSLQASRYIPFGLRAVVNGSASVALSVLIGLFVLGEQVGGSTLLFCAVLVLAAAGVSLGDHPVKDFQPRVGLGIFYSALGAVLISGASYYFTLFLRATHPLLGGWCWETAIGICCIPWVWARRAQAPALPWHRRAWKIGVASSPTAIATSAAALSLALGPFSVSWALAGLQMVFTTLLGVWWHDEKVGARRWLLIAIAAASIAGIAWGMHIPST